MLYLVKTERVWKFDNKYGTKKFGAEHQIIGTDAKTWCRPDCSFLNIDFGDNHIDINN